LPIFPAIPLPPRTVARTQYRGLREVYAGPLFLTSPDSSLLAIIITHQVGCGCRWCHVSSVFMCFRRMFRLFFHVAYVAMAIYACCKRMFQVFHLDITNICFKCFMCFITYVASVSSWCYTSRSRCCIYLQWLWRVFRCFCKYFRRMLQVFQLFRTYIAKVDPVSHMLQCDPLVWEVEGWSTSWRRPPEAEVDDGEYCPSKKQKFHCLKYTPSVPT
jgi:hypothetical protein